MHNFLVLTVWKTCVAGGGWVGGGCVGGASGGYRVVATSSVTVDAFFPGLARVGSAATLLLTPVASLCTHISPKPLNPKLAYQLELKEGLP